MDTDRDLISTITDEEDEMEEVYFNIYEDDVKTTREAKNFIGEKLRIPQREYREKRINDILDKYYKLRGWDKNGMLSSRRTQELEAIA